MTQRATSSIKQKRRVKQCNATKDIAVLEEWYGFRVEILIIPLQLGMQRLAH
jgi:hypothetical protein